MSSSKYGITHSMTSLSIQDTNGIASIIKQHANLPLTSNTINCSELIQKTICAMYYNVSEISGMGYIGISARFRSRVNSLYVTLWHYDEYGNSYKSLKAYEDHCKFIENMDKYIDQFLEQDSNLPLYFDVEHYISNWEGLEESDPVTRMEWAEEGTIIVYRINENDILLSVNNNSWYLRH